MTPNLTDDAAAPAMPDFLANGGEMGALISTTDWDKTPLGAPECWPPALKVVLASLLGCPQPIFLAWGPRLFSFFNDAYRSMLGERLEGAMGRPFAELWSDAWPDLEPIVRRALDGQGSLYENLPLTLTRNGFEESTWWSFSYMPLRDATGAVTGMYCITTEKTEQMRLTQQAAVEQKRQAFRIELGDALRDASTPETLMAIAAEKLGRHLEVACVGYAQVDAEDESIQIHHDWVATGSFSLVGRYGLDDFGPAMFKVLQEGRTVFVSDTAVDPLTAGAAFQAAYESIHVRAFIKSPLIRQGRLAIILFVSHSRPRHWTPEEKALVDEVAERIWASLQRLQTELDLREMNRALEQRTTELLHTETALRQSQKLEALGQLTGGVAHDFNNLLAVISSAVELLRVDKIPVERHSLYLDMIFDTVGRCVKLTSQLLAFARKQPLSPELFDVDLQVKGVADLVRPLMGPQMEVDFEPSGGRVCFAMADISQFETALVNLAVNARDAMNAKGLIRLKVHAVDRIPAGPGHDCRVGEFIAISMSDTGCGIAHDKLQAIFEPFYTTKEVGKGTGLGLSQVFGFTKQSGGEVEVSSVPGSGSVFTLYLARVMPLPSPQSAAALPRPGVQGHRTHVLIVEDNQALAQMTCEILEDLDYRTTWAASAEAALVLLAKDAGRFDLMFSDVIMPGMGGIELGLLVHQRYPGLPVVLTSGYSAVIAEKGRHGFELIQKPYTSEALVRVFSKVIAGPSPA